MTTLVLSAPTNYIAGPPGGGTITGVVLPATEANSIGSNAGISVPNNGSVLVRFTTGSGSAPVINFVVQKTILGEAPAAFTQTLGASTSCIYGTFGPSVFNDTNGLLQITLTGTLTNVSVGVYYVVGTAV